MRRWRERSGLKTSRITSPSPVGWHKSSRAGASRSPLSCLTYTLPRYVLLENLPNTVHKLGITDPTPGRLSSCVGGSISRCKPTRSDPIRRVLSDSLNHHPQSSSRHPICPLSTLQYMHKPHPFATTFPLHQQHRTALHLLPTPLHQPAPPPAHRTAHAQSTPSPSQNSTDRWRWMGSSKT